MLFASRSSRILLLLAFLCAAFNLTKPVHIDDTAYLEIVRAIRRDPFHVMSAQINWNGTAAPIAEINQPHLFFYAQALLISVFGESELVQHLLMAVMSSMVIVFFYLIAQTLVPNRALLLTALLVLGPVFLPGQNLMMDVPCLAFWMIFFWAIISRPRYVVAAFAIAAACLIKYTSLVLIPIFILTLIYRRQWRSLWVIAIPIIALLGWSLLNLYDYGHIHILERPAGTYNIVGILNKLGDWVIGLGAIAPFTGMFLARANLNTLKWPLVGSLLVGIALFFGSWLFGGLPYIAVWWGIFAANGFFTLALTYQSVLVGITRSRQAQDMTRLERSLLLGVWLIGAAAFIILFAPFIAVRHILFAVPAILLLLAYNLEPLISERRAIVGLIFTAALGIVLAASDYAYASVYRDYAYEIVGQLPSGATIWYSGHWGWQWYAREAGMHQYDPATTVFHDGDYVVNPALPRPSIAVKDLPLLKKVDEITVASGPLTWFRTMSLNPGGGYYAFAFRLQGPPWLISTAPLDTFTIYKVEKAPTGQ